MISVPCTCHLSSFSLETRPHSIRFSSISLSFSLHFSPDPAAGITKLCLACASSAQCMLLSHWNPDHNLFIFLPFLFPFLDISFQIQPQASLNSAPSAPAVLHAGPRLSQASRKCAHHTAVCGHQYLYLCRLCTKKYMYKECDRRKKQEKLELGKHPKTPIARQKNFPPAELGNGASRASRAKRAKRFLLLNI
jgi:hypothetical protein